MTKAAAVATTTTTTTTANTEQRPRYLNKNFGKPNLSIFMGTAYTTELTNKDGLASNDNKLEDMVRQLVGGTSERFVPRPSNDDITTDAINGLGEFKRQCQWAEYWHLKNKGRTDFEQSSWKKIFVESPDLLPSDMWERAKNDPDWVWPNPFSHQTYEQQLAVEETVWTGGLRSGIKPEGKYSIPPIWNSGTRVFSKTLRHQHY